MIEASQKCPSWFVIESSRESLNLLFIKEILVMMMMIQASPFTEISQKYEQKSRGNVEAR